MRILYDVKLRRKILTFTTITLVASLAFLLFVLAKSNNTAQTAANPAKSVAASTKPTVLETRNSGQTPTPKAPSVDSDSGSLPGIVSTIAPAQLADPGSVSPSPSSISGLEATPGYTPPVLSTTPEPSSASGPATTPTIPSTPSPTFTRKATPTVTPKLLPTATRKAASTPTPKNTPVKSTPVKSSGKLTLQYMSGNSANTTNSIVSKFKLSNESNSTISLSDVKIRYYYSIDTDAPQSFNCDWSSVGNSNVTGKFKKMSSPKKNADHYLEIGFNSNAGEIKPGESAEVQTRFSKQDWKDYVQSNDYSFKSSSSYTNWNKVVLIVSQDLVYGSEPQ
ncbi:MAG: hypothetical protein GX660_25170 [Clostridiaceae bacterium]|nr:hypothetical protein [Clostridiaceae bacterium]